MNDMMQSYEKNNFKKHITFLLIIFSSVYPLSFGYVGPVPNLLFIEIIAPTALLCSFYFYILFKNYTIFPIGNSVFNISILILGLWSLRSYTNNPVQSANLSNASYDSVGIRAYYTIFNGICIYFYTLWYSCYSVKISKSWNYILSILLYGTILIGCARLLTFFLNIEMPLLKGVFSYNRSALALSSVYRIGGLSEAATLGISILFALHYKRKWKLNFYIILILFIIFLFMSGGRVASFGTLAAITMYCLFVERDKIGRNFYVLLVILGLICIGLQLDYVKGQLFRIARIEGGFAKQDVWRFEAYKYMWNIFLENPFWGKGIGYVYLMAQDSFILQQLLSGGHGAYLSILMNFGIGGAFFFFITLIGNIIRAFIYIIKDNIMQIFDENQKVIIIFILFYFIILSIESIANGSGYNNLRLFLFSGLFSGTISRSIYERYHLHINTLLE